LRRSQAGLRQQSADQACRDAGSSYEPIGAKARYHPDVSLAQVFSVKSMRAVGRKHDELR
jgi:hypothetical protein